MTDYKQKHESLKAEYQVCKRKLDSKCEALAIMSRTLDQCLQERDQFKLMAEQVQERHQALKRQLAGVEPKIAQRPDFDRDSTQSLASLLCEMSDRNKSLQFEVDDLKQKLKDANGDIKLLREQIARQRVGTVDEGMNTRHFPAHEREDLVKQLETSWAEFSQLERDLQQVLDEKQELVTERDVYKTKFDRLNQELNYILKGEENRIIDIDALVMENKYLQQRLKQMEEEKSIAVATANKYKTVLEKKKMKGILKLGQSRSGGVVISHKQVQQLLDESATASLTPQMLQDLQSLAGALLDTVNDKNLALSHQRKTNKILGSRVSELEKKLKTLEVAGLWSIPGASANLEKLRIECEEIKTLIPKQASPENGEDVDKLEKDEENLSNEPELALKQLNIVSNEAVYEQTDQDQQFEYETDSASDEEVIETETNDSPNIPLLSEGENGLSSVVNIDLEGITRDLNEHLKHKDNISANQSSNLLVKNQLETVES